MATPQHEGLETLNRRYYAEGHGGSGSVQPTWARTGISLCPLEVPQRMGGTMTFGAGSPFWDIPTCIHVTDRLNFHGPG